MKSGGPVLVSWVAVNNDPFEREGGKTTYRLVEGKPVPGPTLTVLFDEESPYAGQISDIVLLHRQADNWENDRERQAVHETLSTLRESRRDLRIHLEPWKGEDPTDHRAIFEFLRLAIPSIRKRYTDRELLIHISPGTPSMQTIWVLMAETGFVEPPFKLIKSYRKAERRGRPAVVPVELGIETFYKVYKAAHPRELATEDQGVVWDPGKFKTERMRQVFIEARRFAQLDVPVLILGERGTGKTTLAGWIRLHSPFRKEQQDSHWPAVACGQYIPETMRSELFGYKKGAFTGANKDTDGLLAAADGDTLFLDEIGDLSHDLQRLLIKAVEEKRYLPLDDDRPKKSDFRLLTATNIGMAELRRRLDPDFLDRISVLTIELPPLRSVPDEIPWLWESTYERAVQHAGLDRRRSLLSATHHRRIIAQIRDHTLPGNLRDLFRIAFRVIAARSDPHEPLTAAEAIEYGLLYLKEIEQSANLLSGISRYVARAYADALPLDGLLDQSNILSTKEVEDDLKTYLALELRRIAKSRHISVNQLSDVSERTLGSWLTSRRHNSSTDRKKSSEK